MRIENTRIPGIVPQPAATPHRKPPQRSDSVHLLSEGLSADSQEIGRLTKAIQAGTYRVDKIELAASIIDWTMAA